MEFNWIKQSLQQLTNSTFQHEHYPMVVYQLNLTVSMMASSSLTSTASAYVRITASGITANLVPLGTSMITSGYEQDLLLNPGEYSVDLDGYTFNASVS